MIFSIFISSFGLALTYILEIVKNINFNIKLIPNHIQWWSFVYFLVAWITLINKRFKVYERTFKYWIEIHNNYNVNMQKISHNTEYILIYCITIQSKRIIEKIHRRIK